MRERNLGPIMWVYLASILLFQGPDNLTFRDSPIMPLRRLMIYWTHVSLGGRTTRPRKERKRSPRVDRRRLRARRGRARPKKGLPGTLKFRIGFVILGIHGLIVIHTHTVPREILEWEVSHCSLFYCSLWKLTCFKRKEGRNEII